MYAIMGQIIWLLSFFLRVSGCYHDQQSSYLLSLSWNPRGCRLLASTWTSTCTGAWPESHIFRTEVVVVMACWIFHPAVLLQLSVPCDFWFCIFFTSTTKLLFVLVFFKKTSVCLSAIVFIGIHVFLLYTSINMMNRSDGTEVLVDDKQLKAKEPLVVCPHYLLISLEGKMNYHPTTIIFLVCSL